MTRYEQALQFASEKHRGQYRTGGEPYITHPIAVAEKLRERGYGEEYLITGLFHDLLEDTDATEEEILQFGGARVLAAVKRLTKYKGYRMEEYVASIEADPIAKAVKGADRLHNLECAVVCSEEFKRRYILETIDYYMEFDPMIPQATRALARSMESPITEIGYFYDYIESQEALSQEGRSEDARS